MGAALSDHDKLLIENLRVVVEQVRARSRIAGLSVREAIDREVRERGGGKRRVRVDLLILMRAETHKVGLITVSVTQDESAAVGVFLVFVNARLSVGRGSSDSTDRILEDRSFALIAEEMLGDLKAELPKWRAACENARKLAERRKF